MDRAEIARELRSLVEQRLFWRRPWSGDDPEANQAMSDKLIAWGLITIDPVTHGVRTTELGCELQVDVMSVFMGLHEPHEAPDCLRDFGLITQAESDALMERFNENDEWPEEVLPPLLRQLWRKHFAN
jgi:hypothetical protein